MGCKSLMNYVSKMISKCIRSPQNHIRCRWSTRAKALVTLSTFQKKKKDEAETAGHEKKKVWVEPKEKEGKSIGSWSTMNFIICWSLFHPPEEMQFVILYK